MENLTISDEIATSTISNSNDEVSKVAQDDNNSPLVNAKKKVVVKPCRRTKATCFNCGCSIPVDDKKSLAENFKHYITEKPFAYLITLTAESTWPATILSDFKNIFSQVSREIFVENYYETLSTPYLEGYAFTEYHMRDPSGKSSKTTVHMLIMDYNAMYSYSSKYIPLTETLLCKYISEHYINRPYFKELSVTVQEVTDNSSDVIENLINSVCNRKLSNVTKFGAGRYWCKLLDNVQYLLDYTIDVFPEED